MSEAIRHGLKKTKFVRVAVSGRTVDGREITAEQINQMAETYNPETYGARVNMEHIRGITADSTFKMLGDVIALKAEDVTINGEKRRGLYAQLAVSDDLIEINKKAQKIYSSIEMIPNFAGTNKAYCVGLAVTDSPASLGTEMLQFSQNFNIETLKSEALESELSFIDATTAEPAEPAQDANFFTNLVKNLFKKKATFGRADLEQAFTQIADEFTKHDAKREEEIASLEEKLEAYEEKFTALEEKIESYSTTPAHTFSAPSISGPDEEYEKSKF